MKHIMLVCAAGMSTSLLVLKMKKVVRDQRLDIDIVALPLTEVEDYAQTHPVNLILLGPQVEYQLMYFQEIFQNKIPIEVISMKDYGMMDGEKILILAKKAMEV